MKNNLIIVVICSLFFLLGQSLKSFSQVSITGPVCVIAGTEYQYLISGNWNDQSTFQICIQGGKLFDTDSTCFNGSPVASVHVIWNNDSTGSITINSSEGDALISIERTTILTGGKIDSSLSIQTVIIDSIPVAINCTLPTGGNCSPSYSYQWQKSYNGIIWVDIPNARNESLQFSSAISQNTYFRRKVTEVISNSVEYTDIALVVVTTEIQNGQ